MRWKIKKQDVILCLEFLSRLALEKEQRGKHKATHYLREMKTMEVIKKMFMKIKFVEKKLKKTATTYVTHKSQDGTTEELTQKTELEKAIIKENLDKYRQTKSACPLFQDSLFQDIGTSGNGPAVDSILKGDYKPPPGTSPATTTFLQYMRHSSICKDLELQDFLMSLEDFMESWKNVKEQKSSIDPHIGHHSSFI